MANQHAVHAAAVSIPSTAEIVILTMTPLSENQGGSGAQGPIGSGVTPAPGPQGVVLDANLNVTPSSGTTITLRFRYSSLTGTQIPTPFPAGGLVQTLTTSIANVANAFAIDPTFVETNTIYVLTAQLSAGTATVNYAWMTAQDATSFE